VDDYTFTRQHRGPLVETMNAIWAEDSGVAVVEELLAQLQQLAEDDLGAAAVHEVWEQITDYER
jgi:hypothetical protein